MAPALAWVEVQGFRGFCELQRIEFESDLSLIYGSNSQGKTSLTEAVEFLMTGSCIRRELLGGAKYEFDGALTNVHLPEGKPVFVRAKLHDADGSECIVTRTLTRDYDGDKEVTSDLIIDGVAVTDLSSLGIALGDGAVPASVLVQHSVRYALCAKPIERAKYFSSLLDIEDLDDFRKMVEGLKSRLVMPVTPGLALTVECDSYEPFAGLPKAIDDTPANLDGIEKTLAPFVDIGLVELGLLAPGEEDTREIDVKVQALTAALASRDEKVFSLAPLQTQDRTRFAAPKTADVPVASGDTTEDTSVAVLAAYNEQLLRVDKDIARLLGIYQAVLEEDHFAHLNEPEDCPVCATHGALTPSRVEVMRTQVATTHDLAAAQEKARGQLAELKRTAQRLETLNGVVPSAGTWSAENRVEQQAIVERLLGSDERLVTVLAALPALQDAARTVREAAAAASTALDAADEAVSGRDPGDVPGLTTALTALTDALGDLDSTHAAYKDSHQELVVPLRAATEERAGVTHLRNLAKLVEDRQTLITALREKRARRQAEAFIDSAVKQIEIARGKVFDERLEHLTVDVKKWWALMRPSDVFAFADIKRRGEGRRFVTMESELQATPGLVGSGVTRHSLGIASTSQLNALGLAAFLSRAVSLGVPFVLLDDPVEAGDTGHRATFVANVIPALRQLGIQVIVASHDDNLTRSMSARYSNQGLQQFTLSIDNPVAGVSITSSSDNAKALLDRAKPWLRLHDPEQRQICASKLRVAAERIVKEILVLNRRADGDASITDYDANKYTLGTLIAEVTPYLDNPESRDSLGKLNHARTETNPGSHDGVVPDADTLGIVHGDLKSVWKKYVKAKD